MSKFNALDTETRAQMVEASLLINAYTHTLEELQMYDEAVTKLAEIWKCSRAYAISRLYELAKQVQK